MSASPRLAVEAQGPIAVATASWRHRGNVRATIVVKAQLSFADGVLRQVQAEPVDPNEELGFVIRRAEVLFAGLPSPHTTPARIALWRGDQELMGFDVERPPPGAALCGRLSPFAPERSAHLHGFNPSGFKDAFVDLPDAFDPLFFHASPPRQRVASLAAGDALVIDNIYPGHRRLVLRLPTAQVRGTATVADRSAPLRFVLDTLHLDAGRHLCTLLWRGRIGAKSLEALAEASAVVALEVTDPGRVEGDRPPPWQADEDMVPDGADATAAIDGAALLHHMASPTPFSGQPSSVPAATSFDDDDMIPEGAGATAALTGADMLRAVAAPTPFEAPAAQQPHAMDDDDAIPEGAGETAPLQGAMMLEGIASPTPFGVPASSSDEPAPSIPGAPWASTPADDVPVPEGAGETLGIDGVRLSDDELDAAAAEAEARRAREEADAARREEEERARELAAAEERRRQEAERFAAEQRAAKEAAAERAARERAEKEEVRKKIKGFFYEKFKAES